MASGSKDMHDFLKAFLLSEFTSNSSSDGRYSKLSKYFLKIYRAYFNASWFQGSSIGGKLDLDSASI